MGKTTQKRKPPPEVLAAGGVVINRGGEVLFCHPTNSRWNNWRMPKGLVNPDEDVKKAALREVLEETGYSCKILATLETDVRYRSTDDKGKGIIKVLKMYLMEPIEKIQEPDWENDKFKWVDTSEAESYAAVRERDLILEAIKIYKSKK